MLYKLKHCPRHVLHYLNTVIIQQMLHFDCFTQVKPKWEQPLSLRRNLLSCRLLICLRLLNRSGDISCSEGRQSLKSTCSVFQDVVEIKAAAHKRSGGFYFFHTSFLQRKFYILWWTAALAWKKTNLVCAFDEDLNPKGQNVSFSSYNITRTVSSWHRPVLSECSSVRLLKRVQSDEHSTLF